MDISKAINFNDFDLEKSIVFAKRLGQDKGGLHLKIVSELNPHKNWRDELASKSITFSDDYSEEEREQYAKGKQL